MTMPAPKQRSSPPLILISGCTDDKGAEFTDYSMSLSMNYPLALRAAGGSPWLLPCDPDKDFVADAVRRCDGVLLTGGDDVNPRLYTRRLPPKVASKVHREHAERDSFEPLGADPQARSIPAEDFEARTPPIGEDCQFAGNSSQGVAGENHPPLR